MKINQRHVKRAGIKPYLLATSAVGLFSIGLVTTASAQETTDTKKDDTVVVVTGIRKGIQDAISAKRKSASIIEAVSAEDIGKLPDNSIAESIARLPGIAAQRTNGRAQTLSIRGLGPDYTVTTFNGREQASTNDNRTVEFDQYPSELVSQVKVFKTPDAGMSYQGIAGTADIETVQPLAYGKKTIAVNYRREQNDQKANVPGFETGGNRASLTYINQFLDKTLGVALGVAYNKTPYQAQTREVWGYADGPNNTYVVGGDKDGIQSSYYERTGYLGVVEWKPNDKLHLTIDGYHSDFKELQTIRRMEFGTQWSSATLQPGYVAQNGRIVSGQYNGVTTIIENYNNQRDAKVDSLGLNADYKLTDTWNLNADLSWSKVDRTDLRVESTGGTGPNGSVVTDNIKFTTDPDGVSHFTSGLDYSNFNTTYLTDPGGWGGGPSRSGYVGNPHITDEIKAMKLSLKHKLSGDGPFSFLTFGLNYAERTKDKHQWQSILYLKSGSYAVVPDAYRTGVLDTNFFGNAHGMISYDALGLYNSGFWRTVDARDDTNSGGGDRVSDITSTWSVSEKLTTGYVKLDIDTKVKDIPLSGNIGVQIQGADQSTTSGYANDPSTTGGVLVVSSVKNGANYADILPSLNLNFALRDDINLRFAAAMTISRPRMDDMAGGGGWSTASNSSVIVNNGNVYYWSGNGGGNPKLEPWRANAYDISLEKYYGRKGYISLAAYYKELTSYIYNQTQMVDFTGFLLPGQTSVNDPVPAAYSLANANRTGFNTIKANGQGGYIRGVEFTVSLPFEEITPVLDGFGVIISAAYNESKVSPTGVKIELPGLSPRVVNSTIYYEKNGFSARISNRYRGTWLGEVPNFDSSLGAHYVKSESIIDAQIGYEFKDGLAKGLSVNLSGTNLTDEPFVLYDTKNHPERVLKYEKYGPTYALSVSYKF